MLSSSIEFETSPFTKALLRGSANHPDRDCVVVSNDRATYGELATRARLVGRALIALGIHRVDRVGILMSNSLDFIEILFGSSLIGAIPVLYNARFKAREIIDFCQGEIASFKVPRHVRLVKDWPMGATKTLKCVLRDRINAELNLD